MNNRGTQIPLHTQRDTLCFQCRTDDDIDIFRILSMMSFHMRVITGFACIFFITWFTFVWLFPSYIHNKKYHIQVNIKYGKNKIVSLHSLYVSMDRDYR